MQSVELDQEISMKVEVLDYVPGRSGVYTAIPELCHEGWDAELEIRVYVGELDVTDQLSGKDFDRIAAAVLEEIENEI
jgi:hypothetical protein